MSNKVILAVFKRDFLSYFSSPTGYVFITIFIFMSATAAFWPDRFFMENLANLGQLNAAMPYLLLFFVPAITMGIWAGERSRGTDELLLTLPATDTEVVLGKYLAALGIYSVSLGFALSHVVVLWSLGRPDLGVMAGTYLGYFFMGAMLISVGLVASYLTANATVAFVYGSALCSTFVFADRFGDLFFSGRVARFFEWLSLPAQFESYGQGRFLASSLVYVVGTTMFCLFVNVVLVGRRHWSVRESGRMWLHQLTRSVALLVVAVSLSSVADGFGWGRDLTAEGLHTLTAETRKVIGELDAERPVLIQAFVSPEVPKGYVQTRESLISTLREFDRIGGRAVELVIHDTERYTDVATMAQDNYGIGPQGVPGDKGAMAEIYLGVAFTCGAEQDVVMLDRGLSVEYELTRSVRVVANARRKTVGILRTDAKLNGGFDMQTFQRQPQWSIVAELKRQYKIKDIAPDQAIPDDLDALVVALPSALTQPQIDHLKTWVLSGGPTLLLCDPMPLFDLKLAASQPRSQGGGGNPFGGGRGPQQPPKGSLDALFSGLGVDWDKRQVVWQRFNPHKEFQKLNPEIVFLAPDSGAKAAFNAEHPATGGLQEVVMLFGGALTKAAGAASTFTPLLSTSSDSGKNPFSAVTTRSFFGVQPRGPLDIPHRVDDDEYCPAALITGPLPKTAASAAAEGDKEAPKETPKKGRFTQLNTIVVTDCDMIGEQFFQIRRQGLRDLNFDNVTFALNCVDVLCADKSFISLRSKRAKHRTLERLERETRGHVEAMLDQEARAERDAEDQLKKAQERLDAAVAKIQEDPSLDSTTRRIKMQWVQNVENRRFRIDKARIEEDKKAAIERSQGDKQRAIRLIQGRIRLFAVVLPPLPALLLAFVIFARRRRRENLGAVESRMVRSS